MVLHPKFLDILLVYLFLGEAFCAFFRLIHGKLIERSYSTLNTLSTDLSRAFASAEASALLNKWQSFVGQFAGLSHKKIGLLNLAELTIYLLIVTGSCGLFKKSEDSLAIRTEVFLFRRACLSSRQSFERANPKPGPQFGPSNHKNIA